MQELLNIVLTVVSIFVTGLASGGMALLTAWLNSKIKDKKMATILTQILDIIANAVKLVFQEFVEALKQNGKFDAAAQKQAKQSATDIIMNQLTPELKEFISNNYGDIAAWISEQIEVAIYNLKNQYK